MNSRWTRPAECYDDGALMDSLNRPRGLFFGRSASGRLACGLDHGANASVELSADRCRRTMKKMATTRIVVMTPEMTIDASG